MANLATYRPSVGDRLRTFGSVATGAPKSVPTALARVGRGAFRGLKSSATQQDGTASLIYRRVLPEGGANAVATALDNTDLGRAFEQAVGVAPSTALAAGGTTAIALMRKGKVRRTFVPVVLGFIHAAIARVAARLPAAAAAAVQTGPATAGYEPVPGGPGDPAVAPV